MAKLTGKHALICGDSRNIKVTAPFDLTGYTVKFTVKPATALSSNSDTGATIQKSVSSHFSTSATQSVTFIPLTATDTRIPGGKYKYDLEFTNGATVTSTPADDIEFVEDVTKS